MLSSTLIYFLALYVLNVHCGLLSPIVNAVNSQVDTLKNVTADPLTSCLPTDLSLTVSPDANLTTPELITKYGYPVETHTVTTEDGYILTIFRIPNGRNKTSGNLGRETKPAVLLQHGLLCTSSDWLMNPVEKSLPFQLADLGYDVWLGNARGSTYSRKHVTLSDESLEYWKFSWHQMGKYDIPAVIDHILASTGEAKLYYIGHSMGTTMFWVGMSLRPEYNAKIRSMYALAPVAYLQHMTSPLAALAPFTAPETYFFDLIGHGQLLPDAVLSGIHSVGPLLCGPSPLALAICGSAFFAIAGYDPCQLNSTEQISAIVGHTPASTSSRTVIHYLQLKNSGLFAQYDYGTQENSKQYGSENPPKYDLGKVTAPVAAFYALNDQLSVPVDATKVISQLPNLIKSEQVNFALFNHLDFLYAKDVNTLVYNQVVELMPKNYN